MQLFYGGIEFSIVRMCDYHQEAVFTEDGMDYLYTRIRIDCQGVANPKAMSYANAGGFAVTVPGTAPALTVATIRHQLMLPRQTLLLTDELGNALVESPVPGDFATDVKGGPFPRSLSVTEFQGFKTFFLRYSIETFILECPAGRTFNPLVLSNRWSGQQHVGEDFRATTTYSGQVVFNRSVVENLKIQDGAYNVDNADTRGLILPPVDAGSQRTAIDVVQDAAGNEVAWRVADEERMLQLGETAPRLGGSGITRISGSHGVGSMSAEGGGPTAGTTIFTCNLKAWGSSEANQWMMVQRLFAIVTTLVDVGNPANPNAFFVRNAQVTEGIDQNEKWAELSVAIQQQPTKDNAVIGNLRVDTLRVDQAEVFRNLTPEPGGARGNPGVPNAGFGTGAVALVVQALSFSGPCARSMSQTSGQSPGDQPPPPPSGFPRVSTGSVDNLPEYPSRYGPPPTSQSFYTQYETSMTFDLDSGVIQCPISGVPQSPGSSSPGDPGGSPSSSYNGPSSLLFQVSMPTAELVCSGTAECAGSPPLLPSIQPTDPNLALKRCVIVPQGVVMANDARTAVYRVSFEYRYFFLNAFDTSNPSLAMGALPWVALNFTDNVLTPEMFSPGIFSDPNGGPVAATPQGGGGAGPSQ
jgi:hypothetical protein